MFSLKCARRPAISQQVVDVLGVRPSHVALAGGAQRGSLALRRIAQSFSSRTVRSYARVRMSSTNARGLEVLLLAAALIHSHAFSTDTLAPPRWRPCSRAPLIATSSSHALRALTCLDHARCASAWSRSTVAPQLLQRSRTARPGRARRPRCTCCEVAQRRPVAVVEKHAVDDPAVREQQAVDGLVDLGFGTSIRHQDDRGEAMEVLATPGSGAAARRRDTSP